MNNLVLIYFGINGIITILWFLSCVWREVGINRIQLVYQGCRPILIIASLFGIFTIPLLIFCSIYCFFIDNF
jgi:hypothetical protein